MKKIAIIGSRKAPSHILNNISLIGKFYSDQGYIGVSGDAIGCDQAGMKYFKNPILFTAENTENGRKSWDNFSNESKIKSYLKVKALCPDIDSLDHYVQKLFMRNICQVLGEDCMSPVDLVLYWAPERNGVIKGGTRIAVYTARKHGIPTENLADHGVHRKYRELFKEQSPSLDFLF